MSPAGFIEDPNWADFLPETKVASRARSVPAHDDCSPLDADLAAGHLAVGGTLGRMRGYEERPGQLDCLKAIVRAFNAREHLMIEAGTGVGKSLAYLVPAVLWAHTNDTTVVVSTATRNLQSQLLGADIPRALETLGEAAGKFKVALLKGRANYLCLRAVSEFFAAGFWTMSKAEQDEMPHFIGWLKSTPDGDLDTYEGLPRSQLNCPGEECGGRRCPYFSRCFVRRARQAAAEADLVVVNHALTLADAANAGSGLIPAYGRLVLDEAHDLEAVATEYLSSEFSTVELGRILNRLMRRGRGRHARPAGILAAVDRQLSKGVITSETVAVRVGTALKNAASLTVRIVNAAGELADAAELMLVPARPAECIRYRRTAAGREYSLHGLFKPYAGTDWSEGRLDEAAARLEHELAALVNLLHDLADTLDDAAPENEFNFSADLAAQVRSAAESIIAFANETHFVLRGDKLTHAYWAEKVHPERRPAYLRLKAAPLSVAEDLRRTLYETKDTVVLCSATLRVGGDFRYMAQRLGFGYADEDARNTAASRYRMLTAASPFDYLRQSLVLAPDCLPDPSADPVAYSESLARFLRDLFAVTSGRSLVLFTSYEMMNAVAAHARYDLADAGIGLMVQGEGMSRESMTAALREAAESRVVLFGAQSFWEGVDVAGEALSCVVIARLPFPQLGDPVVEARGEAIDRDGGSSFRDYLLPEAVIRFRQGFGRLIRSRRDRGVVIVSDPRLVTKNYGGVFRRSIPTSVHTVTAMDELLSRTTEFFEES